MDTRETPNSFPSPPIEASPGAKMLYLIKRRASTSREELVAHWFANHMPAVIQAQHEQAEREKPHAHGYAHPPVEMRGAAAAPILQHFHVVAWPISSKKT